MDPLALFWFVVFLAVSTLILGMAARERVLFRISVRNVGRRRGNTLMVIAGLMIGTAIFSSSFTIGDTMDNLVQGEVLKYWDLTDEVVAGIDPSEETDYFNESAYETMRSELAGYDGIDGLMPAIQEQVSVLDVTQQLFEPSITLYALDLSHMDGFGTLRGTSGTTYSGLNAGGPAGGYAGQILIARDSASDLDAARGDTARVFYKGAAFNFTLADILDGEGPATRGTGLYLDLATSQHILNRTGMINAIYVSNQGGVESGMEHTDEVKERVNGLGLRDGPLEIRVVDSKQDNIDEAQESLSAFTDLFLVFGTFSVIAGAMLIVNIFVMLGEERKSEMGIQRAVGMRRHHLTRSFIYEGYVYSVLAAAVGAFVGVGIGYLVILFLEEIFSGFGDGGFDMLRYFGFTPESILNAFSLGAILSLAVILLASWKISRLNIVRAIRGLSEPLKPRKDRKVVTGGLVMASLGLVSVLGGVALENLAFFEGGLALLLYGGFIATRWFLGDRASLSLAGASLLGLSVFPWDWFPPYYNGIEMFILAGLIMVGGAMTVLVANFESMIGVLNRFAGPASKQQAVTRVAISYPSSSRFRTGMTMSMFALIIFTITTLNMMTGIFNANIEQQVHDASGDYDIIGFASELPPEYIDQVLVDPGSGLDPGMFDDIVAPAGGTVVFNATSYVTGESRETARTLSGFDDDFLRDMRFSLDSWVDDYDDEEEVWEAVRTDPDVILIDSSLTFYEYGPSSMDVVELDEVLHLTAENNVTYPKRVIGILKTSIMGGLVSSETVARTQFNFTTSRMVLFDLDNGADPDETGKNIERAFLPFGMQVLVIETLVEQMVKAQNQFFDLFNAYLGLGLIVGIAGLGIITLRAVHERRQQIGMLRALGFTRAMARRVFLIEGTFISLLGIFTGILLGILLGYQMWYYEFRVEGMDIFVIPYVDILLISAIALVATLACTVPPAHQAAKVTPSEALRYE